MSRYDDDKPEECECCDWETTELVKVDAYARTSSQGPFTPDVEKEWGWLCQVCYSTVAGMVWQYPRQYSSDVALTLRMLAWQTNYLASLIKLEVAQ